MKLGKIALLLGFSSMLLPALHSPAQASPKSCKSVYAALSVDGHHELLANLVTYYTCDRMLTSKPLSHAERLMCVETYTRVKVSFIPDTDFETFVAAPVKERAKLNIDGFKGFKAWEANNENTVRCLKEASTMTH